MYEGRSMYESVRQPMYGRDSRRMRETVDVRERQSIYEGDSPFMRDSSSYLGMYNRTACLTSRCLEMRCTNKGKHVSQN